MTNPLLTPFSLPPFSKILPEHVVPAVTQSLENCRAAVENVVAQGAPYTWENLCQPLAEVDDVLGRIFSPVSHLNSVKNSPELREAYEQTLPLLSEYSTWVGQHEGLYKAYRDLRDGDHYAELNTAQKKSVDNALRDFELSGIGLPKEKQVRYGEIAARLSELGNQYSNNVLDATMGWTKLITDESELAGMPESALAAAKAQAEAKEQEGFLLTLDIPSYLPVMTYCDNQALREEMYRAYSTRASDQGPNAGKWDNSPVMAEILALRHELAQLLGFDSYADKSLATKMAENPQQVLDFLTDLAKRARPQGEKELAQLRAFAKAEFGVDELQPWDIAYYSEKQKQHLYSISDDEMPFYSMETMIPFSQMIEGEQVNGQCGYQLQADLEQLSMVMLDSSEIEVKVVLNLNTLLVTQWEENIIQEIQTKEPDQKKLEEMPGIVCYVVQPQDTLWDIAKMFYTTMDDIRKLNDLGEGEVKPRQTLLVVKNSEG